MRQGVAAIPYKILCVGAGKVGTRELPHTCDLANEEITEVGLALVGALSDDDNEWLCSP